MAILVLSNSCFSFPPRKQIQSYKKVFHKSMHPSPKARTPYFIFLQSFYSLSHHNNHNNLYRSQPRFPFLPHHRAIKIDVQTRHLPQHEITCSYLAQLYPARALHSRMLVVTALKAVVASLVLNLHKSGNSTFISAVRMCAYLTSSLCDVYMVARRTTKGIGAEGWVRLKIVNPTMTVIDAPVDSLTCLLR